MDICFKIKVSGLILSLFILVPAALAGPDFTFNERIEISRNHRESNGDTFFTHLVSSNNWNRWHASWSSNVLGAAQYIDNFFGDPRMDDEVNRTRIKLGLGVRFKSREDPELIRKASIRMNLPRASRRLQLIYENLFDEDNSELPSRVFDENTDAKPDTGLRYNLRKKRRYKIDADAGYRFSSGGQYFTRLRGRRDFAVNERFQIRLTESVRWYSRDGWVSLSEIQLNKTVGDDWLLRSSSNLRWAEEESGVEPEQIFSVYKAFSKRRALRFSVGGSWPETPDITEARYYTSLSHRRLLHGNWLYTEVEPGVEFREEFDYDPRFFISIKFEVMLGKVD